MKKADIQNNLNQNVSAQTETKSAKEKGSKSHAWFRYTMIATLCLGLGAGVGIYVKRKYGKEQIDYSNFDGSAYAADAKALLEAYNKDPNQDFTSAELVNIGLEKYRQCEYSYSFGIGTASTIVNQTIRSVQIRNGNNYFEESISRSSMVSLASRTEQTLDVDNIDVYEGKADTDETATYDGSKTSHSLNEYKDRMGKTLDEMFIYTISDETCYENSETKVLDNKNKQITLYLDPELSTYYYKNQMKNMSNLDELPIFSNITLTYTFTEDMTLLHCHVDEKYSAKMGVSVSITNSIDYYYHANVEKAIPALDEPCDYSTEGEIDYE